MLFTCSFFLQACVAFLDNRTRLLQLTTSAMKTDPSVATFVERRSRFLFTKLAATVRDFEEFGFDGVACRTGTIYFRIFSPLALLFSGIIIPGL